MSAVKSPTRKHKLLTQEIRKQLPPIKGQEGKGDEAICYLKLFSPYGRGTWYFTEASARLSDGCEVSLSDADKILRGLCSSRDQIEVPVTAGAHDMQHGMSEPVDSSDAFLGDIRSNQRAESPQMEWGGHDQPGIRLSVEAGAPPGDEEWIRQEGGRDPRAEAGETPGAGRDRAPHQREQNGRRSPEPGADDARGASEDAHNEAQGSRAIQRESAEARSSGSLHEVDVTFFGYCVSPLGRDCDEWGYSSLSEMDNTVVRMFGSPVLGVERDIYWTPKTVRECIAEYPGHA